MTNLIALLTLAGFSTTTFAAQPYPKLNTDRLKTCPERTHAVVSTTQGSGGIELFEKKCHNAAGEVVREIWTNQSDGALVDVQEMSKIKGPAYQAYKEFYRHANLQMKSRLPDPDASGSKDLVLYQQFDKTGKLKELMVSPSLEGRVSQKNWSDISFDTHGNVLTVRKNYSEWERKCFNDGHPNGLEVSYCGATHDVVIDAKGKKHWPGSSEKICRDPKTRKSLRMKYFEAADEIVTIEVYGNDGASEKLISSRTYESAWVADKAVSSNGTPEHAALVAESPVWRILDTCLSDNGAGEAAFQEALKKAQTDLNAYFEKPNWAKTEDARDAKHTEPDGHPGKTEAENEGRESAK
ncbi:MAG: hypothetical protein HY074_18180 [Deltaproteobacteria bacterium]|nr:hypothetical protein [Deltaproteobacteria bacterium]